MPTVTIVHQLTRGALRERMAARAGDLGKLMPRGMATVEHSWRDADTLAFSISAMGQRIDASATATDDALTIDYKLPAMMAMMQPMVDGIIHKAGEKLLLETG